MKTQIYKRSNINEWYNWYKQTSEVFDYLGIEKEKFEQLNLSKYYTHNRYLISIDLNGELNEDRQMHFYKCTFFDKKTEQIIEGILSLNHQSGIFHISPKKSVAMGGITRKIKKSFNDIVKKRG